MRSATSIIIPEQASPDTPDSGYLVIFSKTDGLYYKKDDGTEVGPLAIGGSGSAPANMVTTDTAQTLTAEKTLTSGLRLEPTSPAIDQPSSPVQFYRRAAAGNLTGSSLFLDTDGTLVSTVTMRSLGQIQGSTVSATGSGGLIDNGNRAYSDSNPPESLMMTQAAAPPGVPPAGQVTLYTTDGKTLSMEHDDGTSVVIGPSSSGGGGSSGLTVYQKTADQTNSTVTLADITDWVIPLPANEVHSIDAMMWFSSAATTTGFQFAATVRNTANTANVTPLRFVSIFEYQTSATAWATFTQNAPTTFMAVTTSSYVANAAILCRVTAQVEMGATAGELRFQFRSEVANSAITIRKGNVLRVY